MIIQLQNLQTFRSSSTHIRMNDLFPVEYEKLKSFSHYLLSNNPGYKQFLSLLDKAAVRNKSIYLDKKYRNKSFESF